MAPKTINVEMVTQKGAGTRTLVLPQDIHVCLKLSKISHINETEDSADWNITTALAGLLQGHHKLECNTNAT